MGVVVTFPDQFRALTGGREINLAAIPPRSAEDRPYLLLGRAQYITGETVSKVKGTRSYQKHRHNR